jgi:hypothetical protein
MTTKPKPGTAIADAEREVMLAKDVVAGLIEQRRAIEQTAPARQAEMDSISYAALVEHNKAAQSRLAEIHVLAGRHSSELAAIDAATAEARQRLAEALARVEREAERDNAREVLRHFEDLKANLLEVDEAAKMLAVAYERAEVSHRAILRAGCEKIGHQTFWALVQKSVKWTLRPLPAIGEFQAPNSRVEMGKMVDSWGKTYTGWAAPRLGDGPIEDDADLDEAAE